MKQIFFISVLMISLILNLSLCSTSENISSKAQSSTDDKNNYNNQKYLEELYHKRSLTDKKNSNNESNENSSSDIAKENKMSFQESHFAFTPPFDTKLNKVEQLENDVKKYTFTRLSSTKQLMMVITVIAPKDYYRQQFSADGYLSFLKKLHHEKFKNCVIHVEDMINIKGFLYPKIEFTMKIPMLVSQDAQTFPIDVPLRGISVIYYDPRSFWSYHIIGTTLEKDFYSLVQEIYDSIKSFNYIPEQKDLL